MNLSGPISIEQLTLLPKAVLYKASYDGLVAELPKSAVAFKDVFDAEAPMSPSGQKLLRCVSDHAAELSSLSLHEFTKLFVSKYLASPDSTLASLKYSLLIDGVYEPSRIMREQLRLVESGWLTDPRNANSPANVKDGHFARLDPLSVWAYWTRKLTHPIHIDGQDRTPIASGYVYDLRSANGLDKPICDLSETNRGLLHEASALRSHTIPPTAYVEINCPPFLCLVLEEMSRLFVMAEALDVNGKALPIYLFPPARKWRIPNTGLGPAGTIASFDEVAEVLATIACCALRDFWVVEERERVLGPPRFKRIFGANAPARRVVYLPRIRYVPRRNLAEQAEQMLSLSARAAYWRSDHYRKLPSGHNATKKQLLIAAANGRTPPPGYTWVQGSSVAGVDVERVYRSRSVSHTLFEVLPSKGKALATLSWFQFEHYCGIWLRNNGYDEVRRTVIDNGLDISAIKITHGEPVHYAIQCKHWESKVGPGVVRELEGSRVLRGASIAILMTSSAFTDKAIETAQALGIELIDGDKLRPENERSGS